jgi:hypothetical protein
MGIQAVVVFIGLVFALALGVVAGTWYASSPLAGWLAIGSVPVLWGLMHLIERVTGREIWHYRAPYPYSSMQAAGKKGETAAKDTHGRSATDVAPEQIRRAA